MIPYEVIALRYGHHPRPLSQNFVYPPDSGDPHDGPSAIDYFVWVIRNPERTIVVDTGFDTPEGEARGRTMLCHPVEGLRRLGVDPETVRDVIITHLHYDHAGNLGAFPNATFHLQDAEMAFATGRCMCHGRLRSTFAVEDVVAMVRRVHAGRVRFSDGDAELCPGVSVHLVPGHTRGLQCVRVETGRGPVVLASDAAHLAANIREGNPFPILVDMPAMFESWRRLEALAGHPDRVVPGHDPAVMRLYPRHPCREVEAVLLHAEPGAGPEPGAGSEPGAG
ncbi:MAG: N-acyl homoserine lactonase family protein [Methylobacterium frigidaeris]